MWVKQQKVEKYKKKHGLRQTFENVRLLLLINYNWNSYSKQKIENKDEIIIVATTT